MNIAAFIARRWAFSTPLRHTRNILRMGMGSMALCVAVMAVSLCILTGFKEEIRTKVFGFGSHVVIQPYWSESEDESLSLAWDSTLQAVVYACPRVASAQHYALKGALVKGGEDSYGVFFKGLPENYDTGFFFSKLVKGRLVRNDGEVLVSQVLARKLKLDTGRRLRAFFVHEGQLRPRAFTVAGIYATGLEDFDATYIISRITPIQALNGWSEERADGLDLRLKDPVARFAVAEILNETLPYEYSVFPCDRLFPSIFDWLTLIDANVLTLITIMLIVCMICLISLLFILIIERRAHIGVLKAMGASKGVVRRIFIRMAMTLLGRALLIGNALALLLCALQKITGLLKLDESVYFLDRVPVAFPWLQLLGINLIVCAFALLLLGILTTVVNKATPTRLNRR